MTTPTDIDLTKIDLYDFLGLAQGPNASTKEINRAGRQTSFRYHPDKVEATPENLEKFHTAQIAISVLTDPEQKSKYDQQREARLRRKAEVDALDERRRKMAQDLESREKAANNVVAGQKRTFSEREMKIRAVQEANRQKLEQRNAQIRAEADHKAAEAKLKETQEKVEEASKEENGTSIRLRWVREGDGREYDKSSIENLFPEQDVDHVILLTDKKKKIEGRGKVLMGTAVVTFHDAKGAANAMRQKSSFSAKFESVDWVEAANK